VNILQPGPGVGGHCIAVDPWFIIHAAPDESPLMQAARHVNDAKPNWVVDKVTAIAAAHPGARVACLGLAYKSDVDDLRESPALEIAMELARSLAGRVTVVEPNVEELPAGLAGLGVTLCDVEAALAQCDIIAVLVGHAPFKTIDRASLRGKQIIDTIGLWRGA